MEGHADPGKQFYRVVFITERYGEISEQKTLPKHELPDIGPILRALNRVEIACESQPLPVARRGSNLSQASRERNRIAVR